jgi:cbb3-type cytochrome oxidase cytochrome c subunit
VNDLASGGAKIEPDREIVALIAYLTHLGKVEKDAKIANTKPVQDLVP